MWRRYRSTSSCFCWRKLPCSCAWLVVYSSGGYEPGLVYAAGASRRLPVESRFAGVRSVGVLTVLVVVGGTSGAERLFERLGFRLTSHRSPLGRFGEFWENLYTWALMWGYHQVSLDGWHLLHLERTEVWVTVEDFLYRYGAEPPGGVR